MDGVFNTAFGSILVMIIFNFQNLIINPFSNEIIEINSHDGIGRTTLKTPKILIDFS